MHPDCPVEDASRPRERPAEAHHQAPVPLLQREKWGWVDEANQVTPLGDASDVPHELVARDEEADHRSK